MHERDKIKIVCEKLFLTSLKEYSSLRLLNRGKESSHLKQREDMNKKYYNSNRK